MVVGIGIGTPMALNGTVSHAFAHILYKALLFMSMGAVLFRTGKINGSELGGLYKSMPLTACFCMIGAASISSFPLTSGFVSKSLVIDGAAQGHYLVTWLVLLFASAGVFHHSGIKIPFFAFFAHDSGIRCKEAPGNMLLAMGLAAALCIGIGVYPQPLYDILPHRVEFHPYKATHVITQLQLLFLSGLAFTFMKKTGIYPPELRSTNLDTDWFYRRLPRLAWGVAGAPVLRFLSWTGEGVVERLPRFLLGDRAPGDAIGRLPRPWAVSRVVVVVMLTLVVYLLFVFTRSR
jgi:multicomponent Na+:H+ antiporter subunit D